jgi:uncharacterized protein (DUF427 family)
MNKPVRVPNEIYPIRIAASQAPVVVTVAGKVIATTFKALMLDESSGGRTFYIPREDVDMALLKRSEHVTHDPNMGDCAYYSIPAGGARSRDAAWSFEAPLLATAAIKDYLAFAPNRVDAIIEWPAD